MKDNIRERVKQAIKSLIEDDKTIREIADEFNVSPATIGRDLSEVRVKKVMPSLWEKVRDHLKEHKNRILCDGGMFYKNVGQL